MEMVMKMKNSIFEVYNASLMKRLGQVYNGSMEYRDAVRVEDALFQQFREKLTDEQKRQLDDCFNAACHSAGICEKLAYRQGMRDMIMLLYDK